MTDLLSLRMWREVGRSDNLQEALSAAFALLRSSVTPAQAVIRLAVPEHRLWETIAGASAVPSDALAGAARVTDAIDLSLPAALRDEQLVFTDASTFARRHPGVVPQGAKGPIVVAVLSDEPRLTALLVLMGLPQRRPSADQRSAMLAMLEPLAAALRQYVRQRETAMLREAAEADRRALLNRLGRTDITESIIGSDTGLRQVMEQVAQVARSDAPVLLLGETGSGKEVVARAIHRGSDRSAAPFVRVNCGAIPVDLIDSELFGHERGSFTGAVAQRKGWFERADGGTLFMDEVAELPLAAQVRLLRVLQDGLVQRVGAERTIAVDARIIAATNQNVRSMMREGRFREDLWYRLAVFPIEVPALRERPGDLPALAAHFAQRAAAKLGLTPCMPSEQDIRMLCGYDWPGNIRELSSVIERAAILGNGQRLEVATALGAGSEAEAVSAGSASSLRASSAERVEQGGLTTLDEQMRLHIEAALRKSFGRVDGPFGAALQLGLHPQTLRSRMRKLGIAVVGFRQRVGHG